MTEAKRMLVAPQVAGALFDFLGYLTCLKEPLTVGSNHEVPLAMEALQAWADKRGLSLDEADVNHWHDYPAASPARAE